VHLVIILEYYHFSYSAKCNWVRVVLSSAMDLSIMVLNILTVKSVMLLHTTIFLVSLIVYLDI